MHIISHNFLSFYRGHVFLTCVKLCILLDTVVCFGVNTIMSLSTCPLCLHIYVCVFVQAHACASAYRLICVSSDLSSGNSCSGVELITGWVFWEALLATPSLSAVLQGSLQMTECFCPALWNPCHIPFRRTAQQQRSLHVVEQIGKRHWQNFGGKRPQFVPSGSCCVDYQKHRIFV